MADEKLPEHVEKVVADACLAIMSKDTEPFSAADVALSVRARLREMIHRYALEREAAALERAAKVCDRVAGGGEMKTIGLPFTHDGGKVYDHGANYCAWEIRALIHKEPANG